MIEDKPNVEENKEPKRTNRFKQIGLPIVGLVAILVLLSGGFYGYVYASTPEHLRNPKFEHYHVRTQIIIDGQPVDFSREEFQEDYDASTCSADITGQPVDFHDNEDQLAHVHWRGVTGGEFLKFYGWNLIGGENNLLGRRYDQGWKDIKRIETAGQLLPTAPNDIKYYVYTGNENEYQQKDWSQFLSQDIEEFLGKKSLLNNGNDSSFNVLDLLTQKVSAHGAEVDGHKEGKNAKGEGVDLERINNLLGNIVIFAQKDEPSRDQIKERFNNLTPLHDSVCGG